MPAKLAVIIFFAVATILNAWQAVDIRLEFVIADVFPDDSYIPEFIAMSKRNAYVLCRSSSVDRLDSLLASLPVALIGFWFVLVLSE